MFCTSQRCLQDALGQAQAAKVNFRRSYNNGINDICVTQLRSNFPHKRPYQFRQVTANDIQNISVQSGGLRNIKKMYENWGIRDPIPVNFEFEMIDLDLKTWTAKWKVKTRLLLYAYIACRR